MGMRRGPGIVALDRKKISRGQYSCISQEWNEAKLNELRERFDEFSCALRSFAIRHRRDIRRNPEFRHAFQRMCASLLVDPLAGHPTTFGNAGRIGQVVNLWSELTGFSDWQYELGVQIVDVCISTRSQNGGIITMDALIRGVLHLRHGKHSYYTESLQDNEWKISSSDIERSIKALEPLGCGYEVFDLQGIKMVRTVARELSSDSKHVLNFLALKHIPPRDYVGIPYATPKAILSSTKRLAETKDAFWTKDRAAKTLEDMLMNDGTLWLDIVPNDTICGSSDYERKRYYAIALSEINSESTQ